MAKKRNDGRGRKAPSGQKTDVLSMFPDEVEAKLGRGEDIAIVTIGSVEQHGPALLLGCDGFGVQGFAAKVAEHAGGTLFPIVPFSWTGGTDYFSGAVSVRSLNFVDYLKAVVRSLWRTGFRRILLMNAHGGNFYTMRAVTRDLLKDDGIPVLCTYAVPRFPELEKVKGAGGEASGMCGGLTVLGRDDLVAAVKKYDEAATAEFGDIRVNHEPESFRRARPLGVIGHDYWHECLHVRPGLPIDEVRAVEMFDLAGKRMAELLELYGQYVDDFLAAKEAGAEPW
jgi:creatinine amidohydrolase/Fe(II)-dependent formamide hydrolase-like protein